MKSKKLLFGFLVSTLLCVLLSTSVLANNEQPKVYVNNEQLNVNSVIEDGRTLVPFRAIFQALGLDVEWVPETHTVTGVKTGTKISLQIGSKSATINGESKQLDVAPKIINDSTFVPIRFISENTGAEVVWDGNTKSVKINSSTTNEQKPQHLNKLRVHYIDVGQADSILIQTPQNKNILIDAGNNNDGVAVVTYLKKQGVNTIDLLVGTHPHEDHIGGLDTVINNLTIKEIYMPKVAHTSQTFKDVLTAIQAKNLTVTTPVAGSSINIDPSIKLEILAPNSQTYDDFNNYSIVLKLTYKNTSYLFTGDAEYTSENETLAKHKTSLNSDVLKVGHHGSNSSTSSAFLNAVSPKYAVISVGAGNSYGHPSELTIDSLNNAGVQIYRTDEVGTIISTSDGNVIMFDKNTSVIKPHAPPVHLDLDFDDDDDYDLDTSTSTSNLINDEDEEEESDNSQTVYVTNTGTKYHAAGCRHLSKSKIPISLSQAKQKYEPCSVCNPPR